MLAHAVNRIGFGCVDFPQPTGGGYHTTSFPRGLAKAAAMGSAPHPLPAHAAPGGGGGGESEAEALPESCPGRRLGRATG